MIQIEFNVHDCALSVFIVHVCIMYVASEAAHLLPPIKLGRHAASVMVTFAVIKGYRHHLPRNPWEKASWIFQ